MNNRVCVMMFMSLALFVSTCDGALGMVQWNLSKADTIGTNKNCPL